MRGLFCHGITPRKLDCLKMPESSQKTERSTSPSYDREEALKGYSPQSDRPLMVGSGKTEALTNIRDRQDRSLPLRAVLEGFEDKLSPEQKTKIAAIHAKAQDQLLGASQDERPAVIRNRGQDIRDLLPKLVEQPELIDSLYNLATAETFFGISDFQDFEKHRADFLIDVLQNAAHPNLLTQGPRSLCTAASMLKTIDRGEYLRLACELGVEGRTLTQSGKVFACSSDDIQRSVKDSIASLDDIRSVRPSAGSLAMLEAVMNLGIPPEAIQDGAFWWQYTDAWRHLTGKQADCFAGNTQIGLNGDGTPAVDQAAARKLAVSDYVFEALQSGKKDGILIDTEWSHVGAYAGASGHHGRHMLVARGVETRAGADGVVREYLVCDNPIGKYVDQSKDSFHAVGTVLGRKNGFHFEVGEGSKVYISRENVNSYLRTVVVERDEKFVYDSANETRPAGIGELGTEPILFVNCEEGSQDLFGHQKAKRPEREIKTQVVLAVESQQKTRPFVEPVVQTNVKAPAFENSDASAKYNYGIKQQILDEITQRNAIELQSRREKNEISRADRSQSMKREENASDANKPTESSLAQRSALWGMDRSRAYKPVG